MAIQVGVAPAGGKRLDGKRGSNASSTGGSAKNDDSLVQLTALLGRGGTASFRQRPTQATGAMGDAMGAAESKDIEVRLILALEAGADAGGEPDGQRSAGIVVYENEGFSVINLRVDDHPDPIMELRRLFDKLYPLVPYYRARPDDPRIGTVGDWARARGIDK